ncbi:melanopsin-B-like [Oculina patagonica]
MVAAIYIVFAVISAVIFPTSIVLNGLVCLVFYKNKQFRKPPNVFIISVAVSDLFFSTTTIPLHIATNAYGKWIYGEGGCKAAAFITFLAGLTSLMHLAAASYERYIGLVHPLTSHRTFTFKRTVRISVAMWLYALFWSVLPLCGWSGFELEGVGTSCSVRWRSRNKLDLSYNICLILACFVFPVSLISFSYFNCCKEIMSGTKRARHIWGKKSPFTRKAFEVERRMVLVFGVMTVAFLMAWTPYAVVSLISMIAGPDVISDVAASIPAYIAKSSACYNPIIYVFLYKRLRCQIYLLVRRKSNRTRKHSSETERCRASV